MIQIKRGFDLPITGAPDQSVCDEKGVASVAVLGPDFIGMKPTMEVRVADTIKKGQILFTDKKTEGVRYTAPAAGKVLEIHRGEKRALLSVVIQLSGNDEIAFASYPANKLNSLKREQIREQLLESGQWVALRTRPFSKVADPSIIPNSIFVTVTDSNPLAPDISKILAGQEADFDHGITVLSKLTDGTVHVCKSPETAIGQLFAENVQVHDFSGPHPSGLVGTHIHFIEPVSRKKTVWHIGVQDVIAIGKLFTTGSLHSERIISLAGPAVKNPRLIRTQIGASIGDLVEDELIDGENRTISGSVWGGFQADGSVAYLGRYDQQVSVLAEYRHRDFLGWLNPFINRFSMKNIIASSLNRKRQFPFDTSTNGEERAIIPNGSYERVMPLDIMPLFLMRALAVDDVEEAEALGCLELDEEDLALCAFVCPSKLEFGPLLRRNLTLIEKEG